MGSENIRNSDAFGREDPRTSCSPGEISLLDMTGMHAYRVVQSRLMKPNQENPY